MVARGEFGRNFASEVNFASCLAFFASRFASADLRPHFCVRICVHSRREGGEAERQRGRGAESAKVDECKSRREGRRGREDEGHAAVWCGRQKSSFAEGRCREILRPWPYGPDYRLRSLPSLIARRP